MARTPPSLASIQRPLTSRTSHIVALIFVAAAFALLIVVDATAPVNHGLALFTARNDRILYNEGRPVVRLGTFGYCFQVDADFSSTYDSSTNPTPDRCSTPSIGYNPIDALVPVSPASALGNSTGTGTSGQQQLTSPLVLHPLATGLSFLALASALLPARLAPPIIAPFLLATVTTLLALAALACDFVLFGRVGRRIADQGTSARGHYDVGMWAVVAAFVCLSVSTALLGLRRWWFQRRLRGATIVSTEMQRGTGQDEDKTDGRSTDSSTPPYEVAGKTGPTELSRGAGADRHELDDQGKRVELDSEERYELDTPATYVEPRSRVGEDVK
ncbi:pali-domain-containing protein [Hypoxylon sp. FL1150]|nr:pali-domain-containing protein [Hypoxylon sp. FL1150]